MNLHFLRWMPVVVIGWIVVPAHGQAVDSTMRQVQTPQAKQEHHWSWLSEADKQKLLHSIPPVPLPGSAQDKADLAGVLKAQAERTPEQIAEARDDQKFRLQLVSRVLTPQFVEQTYPKSFLLLKRVDEDESFLNSTLKKEYHRNRPYVDHPQVKALFVVEQFSYPSGHASGSHTLANILSELFPAQKTALQDRAEAVGESRVIAGVHYPSDVEEGKVLAEALTDALMANAAFKADLAAAQAEVASLPGAK